MSKITGPVRNRLSAFGMVMARSLIVCVPGSPAKSATGSRGLGATGFAHGSTAMPRGRVYLNSATNDTDGWLHPGGVAEMVDSPTVLVSNE